jgi:hypothetical protein
MTRPLYLDFPGQSQAYQHPTEYLYGPDMLVAPVTTPGDVAATSVWFPPGRWTDMFTGATFNGPATATLEEPLGRMPVFVRAGGLIPEQAPVRAGRSSAPPTFTVLDFPGAAGSFTLYQDAGSGLGYTKGQRSTTRLTTTSSAPGHGAPLTVVTLGATSGRFAGEPTSVAYRLEVVDLSRPTEVTLDGGRLTERADPDGQPSWSYDPATATVTVVTGPAGVGRNRTVVVRGALPLQRTEPPVAA